MKEFFTKNRNKVYSVLNDGDFVLMFAGEAPTKRGDEKYLFSPDRNFYYLTGIDSEKCAFLMARENGEKIERLYIQRDNGHQAKWVGANITAECAASESGIDDVKFIDELKDDMVNYKKCVKRIFVDFSRSDIVLDELWNEIKNSMRDQELVDIFPIMAQFRVVKEKEEIERIQSAIEITIEAIKEMMKNTKAGMMEYEIEAYYDYTLTKNGVRDKAFNTIVASGANGTVLHYSKNNSKVEDGDLILVDAGAQLNWYNGDITRTFPANGKFSEKQKIVYNIVLKGQELVINSMKPGVPIASLNEKLKDYYFEELKKIGLVKNREDVFKYYYHNVGHFLGAETHDVGNRDQTLKEGMVLTVEPGLYVEEWDIGIRIEDDVLVTENGCEILSAGMMKTVEEIEEFMADGR